MSTMSTASQADNSETARVELIPNEEANTVTFVADLEHDNDVPPTEWITVGVEDTVNVTAHR